MITWDLSVLAVVTLFLEHPTARTSLAKEGRTFAQKWAICRELAIFEYIEVNIDAYRYFSSSALWRLPPQLYLHYL